MDALDAHVLLEYEARALLARLARVKPACLNGALRFS